MEPAMVSAELKRRDIDNRCGGLEYLRAVQESYVRLNDMPQMKRKLRELRLLREAMEVGKALYDRCQHSAEDPLETLSSLRMRIDELIAASLANAGRRVSVEVTKSNYAATWPNKLVMTQQHDGLRFAADDRGPGAGSLQTERAQELLLSELSEGPRGATELLAMAADAGISEPTLQRAATELGVEKRREQGGDGRARSVWLRRGWLFGDLRASLVGTAGAGNGQSAIGTAARETGVLACQWRRRRTTNSRAGIGRGKRHLALSGPSRRRSRPATSQVRMIPVAPSMTKRPPLRPGNREKLRSSQQPQAGVPAPRTYAIH